MRFSGIGRNPYHLTFFGKRLCRFSFFQEYNKQSSFSFINSKSPFFLSKLKFFQISRYFSIPRLLFLREILFISVNNPGAKAPKVIIPPVAIIANVAFKTDLAVLFSEIILFICFTTPWSKASNFIGLCFGIFKFADYFFTFNLNGYVPYVYAYMYIFLLYTNEPIGTNMDNAGLKYCKIGWPHTKALFFARLGVLFKVINQWRKLTTR